MTKPFLTAKWRNLLMANYAVSPDVLQPYLPPHTELDFFEDHCYVSLVGFLFDDVRLRGYRIPFHTRFPEVNLRFYVHRKTANGELRRGVVFISEIVPRFAIAWVANTFYQEKYISTGMAFNFSDSNDQLHWAYYWKWRNQQNHITANLVNAANPIKAGSKEEFIFEHYYGYAKAANNVCNEYEVSHPSWNIYPVDSFSINCNFSAQYGQQFSFLNDIAPASIFAAEGSSVIVRSKTVINSR